MTNKPAPKWWGKAECGTASGYNLHKSRKQVPCEPCRLAHNLQTSIGARAAAAVARLHPELRAGFVSQFQYEERERFESFKDAAKREAEGQS